MTHHQTREENEKELAERKHEQTLEKNENYTDPQNDPAQANIHDAKRYGEVDHMDTDEENSDLDHGRLTGNEDAPESTSGNPHGDEGIHDSQRYGEADHMNTDEETSGLDAGHLTENDHSESGFEDDGHHGQQEKHDSEQERYMGGNSADEDDELAKKLGDRRGMPQDS